MYFVPCPRCGAPVDVPTEAVGPKRTLLWNITYCDECEFSFDYDDIELETIPDTEVKP